MDPVQILLFAVVTVLTLLLVAVGIQVFFILREAREAIVRLNKILEDAEFVSSSVTKPVATITSFVEGVRSVKDLIDFIAEKTDKRELASGEYEEGEVEEPEHTHIKSLQERGRRFFHKGGKPLTS